MPRDKVELHLGEAVPCTRKDLDDSGANLTLETGPCHRDCFAEPVLGPRGARTRGPARACALGSSPQLLRRQLGALGERGELHPHDLGIDLQPAGDRPALDETNARARPAPSPFPLPQWGRGLRRVGEADPRTAARHEWAFRGLTRSWVRGAARR